MSHVVLADADVVSQTNQLDFDRWKQLGATITEAACQTEDDLIETCRKARVIVYFGNDLPFTQRVLHELHHCVLIQRIAVGFDSVDIDTATQLGIMVANCAGYCDEEVANHALALLLACHQQLGHYHHTVTTGRWQIDNENITPRLSEQILGIVGLGRIGSTLACRAGPLVQRIVVYDPYISNARAEGVGAELVDLETLLKESDLVSLHCPLTKETRHLIDARALKLMKRSASLVNTARGPVVDLEALYDALESGHLRSVGLDVLTVEPPPQPLPEILLLPNVITTPHCAASSPSSITAKWRIGNESVASVLAGKRPGPLVNPQLKPRLEQGHPSG